MEQNELGFVIKRNLPHKQTVCLLTETRGKINVLLKRPPDCRRLWPGMLISFHAHQERNNTLIIDDPEVLMLFEATQLAHTKLLHQILELCYFFLPLQDPAAEIFSFLYQLLKTCTLIPDERELTEVFLIAKLKLLTLFGFAPEKEIAEIARLFDQFPINSIDFGTTWKVKSPRWQLETFNQTLKNKADKWIMKCASSHPRFPSFKTLSANTDGCKN